MVGAVGTNKYRVFTPSYQLFYAHGKDTMVSTVLRETRTVDGIVTRVFEDREMKNGRLSEVTRDYFRPRRDLVTRCEGCTVWADDARAVQGLSLIHI